MSAIKDTWCLYGFTDSNRPSLFFEYALLSIISISLLFIVLTLVNALVWVIIFLNRNFRAKLMFLEIFQVLGLDRPTDDSLVVAWILDQRGRIVSDLTTFRVPIESPFVFNAERFTTNWRLLRFLALTATFNYAVFQTWLFALFVLIFLFLLLADTSLRLVFILKCVF